MTVRQFIHSLTKEDYDKELLIASDEEGNSYHTVDPEITVARMENGELLDEVQGKPNVLILTPFREVPLKDEY